MSRGGHAAGISERHLPRIIAEYLAHFMPNGITRGSVTPSPHWTASPRIRTAPSCVTIGFSGCSRVWPPLRRTCQPSGRGRECSTLRRRTSRKIVAASKADAA
jgi:hypothetical protein